MARAIRATVEFQGISIHRTYFMPSNWDGMTAAQQEECFEAVTKGLCRDVVSLSAEVVEADVWRS